LTQSGHAPWSNSIMNAALVYIRDTVAALKKAGRTLDETVAAKSTAAHDAKWGQFLIGLPFTKLVYVGV
jgi:hypothetical protein